MDEGNIIRLCLEECCFVRCFFGSELFVVLGKKSIEENSIVREIEVRHCSIRGRGIIFTGIVLRGLAVRWIICGGGEISITIEVINPCNS